MVPIVVAILLTVLLSPVASRLERRHLSTTASALIVWFAAVVLIAFVGWLVVNQGIHMASQLLSYSATISKKIETIRGARNSPLGRAAESARQLLQEFSSAIESTEKPQQNQSLKSNGNATSANARQTKPVPVEYDSVLMPVLVLAEGDRADSWFDGQRRSRLFREMRTIVEELSIRYAKNAAVEANSTEISPDDQILPYRHPGAPAVIVSCIPVRDEGDEIACVMLAHLLKLAGYNAHEVALGTQRAMLDEIAEHDGQVITFPRCRPSQSLRFAACSLWQFVGTADSMRALLDLAEPDLILTSLGDSVVQIQRFVELQPQSAHEK